MSIPAPDPVLESLVRAAIDATGAADGWLLGVEGEELQVLAAAGAHAVQVVGSRLPAMAGTTGYVVGSGQPLAIVPRPDDPRIADSVAGRLGVVPSSVLAVPCLMEDGIVGALELVDKQGGSFSFDDIEIATLLSGVAGVAIVHRTAAGAAAAIGPAELAGEMQRLAQTDPARYAIVTTVVSALLGQG